MSAGREAELAAEVARLRAENERHAANLDRWEEARAIRAALVAALQAALVALTRNAPPVGGIIRDREHWHAAQDTIRAALKRAGVDP